MNHRRIKLAQDTISRDDIEALVEWLREDHQLTKGPLTQAFEAALAEYVGTKYAIMVNSGSSANLLMASSLLEAGYLRNKKVVVPAVSWITTLSPFIQLGFECFLCDSDPDDLGVDLDHLEELLRRERPALMIVVHILGHPNKMRQIRSLCETYDCLVIEDACEALGSEYDGVKTGALSLAGSFSFYYGHHISTIEGGAIATSDEHLYSTMLSIRSHGWSRDLPESDRIAWRLEHGIDEFREFYSFYYAGYNLRSTDLNAFLGLQQLRKLPEIVQLRSRNFERYRENLPKLWVQRSEGSFISSFAYGTFVRNRLELARHLRGMGIECRPLVCGSMGRQPFWIRRYGAMNLDVADRVHDFGLYLPNHAALTADDISYITNCVNEVAIPL